MQVGGALGAMHKRNDHSWFYVSCPAWGDTKVLVYKEDEQEIKRTFRTDQDNLVIEKTDMTWTQGLKAIDAEDEYDAPRSVVRKVPTPVDPRTREAIEYLTAYAGDFQFLLDVKSRMRFGLSPKQVDAVLKCKANDEARAQRTAQQASSRPQTRIQEDGWYKVGEDVFKVQIAVHGSGNLYAKKLVVTEYGKASWEYAPGMVARLTADQKLSLDAARAFGKLYGVCCVCGATLTDETSIENGIGPVCSGRLA